MTLPFQEHEHSALTRRIILDDIASAQASIAAAAPFVWHGQAYIVHQGIVLKADEPPTAENASFYGGEDRFLFVLDAIDILAWLVEGSLAQHVWLPAATVFLNLVAAQPLVNPAIEPFFWCALHRGLWSDAPDDLMAVLRPLTFDLTVPADAAAVRAAQADYFGKALPGAVPADWRELDDAAWAQACGALVEDRKYGIELDIFDVVKRRAGR